LRSIKLCGLKKNLPAQKMAEFWELSRSIFPIFFVRANSQL